MSSQSTGPVLLSTWGSESDPALQPSHADNLCCGHPAGEPLSYVPSTSPGMYWRHRDKHPYGEEHS